jgi:hypothetical protein
MTANNEIESVWKEELVAQLCGNLPKEPEEYHENF